VSPEAAEELPHVVDQEVGDFYSGEVSAGNGQLTASSVSAHHAVLVLVSGTRLLLAAVDVGGKVVDRLELYQPHAK